jgi:hypothetical protein
MWRPFLFYGVRRSIFTEGLCTGFRFGIPFSPCRAGLNIANCIYDGTH